MRRRKICRGYYVPSLRDQRGNVRSVARISSRPNGLGISRIIAFGMSGVVRLADIILKLSAGEAPDIDQVFAAVR
jgi:hypothetical protein